MSAQEAAAQADENHAAQAQDENQAAQAQVQAAPVLGGQQPDIQATIKYYQTSRHPVVTVVNSHGLS